MSYIFTTLAVDKIGHGTNFVHGSDYTTSAIESCKNLGSVLKNANFNITTNVKIYDPNKFLNLDIFELSNFYCSKGGFAFHLNLKSLALKYCLDKDFDYVIYFDADWAPTDNLKEENFIRLFDYMESNGLDFLCERPFRVGTFKNNPNKCFFKEKVDDYHLLEHDFWDDAHVFNEQFMVFKNNYKFRFFVNRWEQFLWWTVANDIRNYPDGFEIGVSALESRMNYDCENWFEILRDCFKFYDRSGNLHHRF